MNNSKDIAWIMMAAGAVLALIGLLGFAVCLTTPTIGKILFLYVAVGVILAVLSAVSETRQVIQPAVTSVMAQLNLPGYIAIAAILVSLLSLCELRDMRVLSDHGWPREPGAVLAAGQQKATEATDVAKDALTAVGDFASLVWTGEKPTRPPEKKSVRTVSSSFTVSPSTTKPLPESKVPFWTLAAVLLWVAFGVVIKYAPKPTPAARVSEAKPAEPRSSK
ncbi:MAG: hypothetical protein A3A24_01120 [Candidatus Buchananbacteria bacterium RIFCSPLOWO2_01_FULL_46_12]|uniref:Uncharacterized protein n=2 Tax=Candidatus Buchananiibacteriota TaxID=1817903 RepID=A0A1G1YRT6_9BACT|nr:MAG: hypothetical protein A2744_00300 [Candidatus Buchananbacteria bacterium RIFCSPHIGHO2_01_FULL_44_11]OGY55065.1 MAG: hypothetical protein A3A24_01120 [Candidatus Buchananbacteria bacterium RIFCSPLOWO2_01_FULL_46_12]